MWMVGSKLILGTESRDGATHHQQHNALPFAQCSNRSHKLPDVNTEAIVEIQHIPHD